MAEGVETREQLELLRACGCQEMQGYVFSRPLPPEELLALLRAGQAAAALSAQPSTLAAGAAVGVGWQRPIEPSAQIVRAVGPAGAREVGAQQVGTVEHRPGEVRAAQVGLEQPGRAQAGADRAWRR